MSDLPNNANNSSPGTIDNIRIPCIRVLSMLALIDKFEMYQIYEYDEVYPLPRILPLSTSNKTTIV